MQAPFATGLCHPRIGATKSATRTTTDLECTESRKVHSTAVTSRSRESASVAHAPCATIQLRSPRPLPDPPLETGALTSMRVPLPRAELTFTFPPMFPMRSRIPAIAEGLPASGVWTEFADPIVLYRQAHRCRPRAASRCLPCRVGMLGDVVQGLLHHAIEGRLHRRGQPAELRRDRDARLYPALLARSLASLRTAAISPSSCNTRGDSRAMMRRIPSIVRSTTSRVSRIFARAVRPAR